MSELFVLGQQALVDPLQFPNMVAQVPDHFIGALQLLNQRHGTILVVKALPSHECTPDSFHVVVLAESNSKFLSSDEVSKQVFALEG